MADQWIQTVAGTEGTTTTTGTITVTAGSTIIIFLWTGNTSTPASSSVADAQGSYTAQAVTAADGVNAVWAKAFTLENANAGAHNWTGTLPATTTCFSMATEVAGPASSAVSGENAAFQGAVSAGADILSSGSVTATSTATLIGMSSDTASVNPSDEPTAGTGFSSRLAAANGTIGAHRVESKSIATSAAATFGAVTTTDHFITIGVAVLNSGVVAAGPPMLPLLQVG